MRLIGCRRAWRHPRCRGGFVVMPEGGSGPGVPAQGPPPRPRPSPRTGSPACPWQPGLPAALCPWHSHLSAPWICQVWPRGAPGEPRSHCAPFTPAPSSPASALPCPVAFFRLSVTVLVPFRLLHSGEISASTRVLHHLHPVSPVSPTAAAQSSGTVPSELQAVISQSSSIFPYSPFCKQTPCFPCLTPAFCCRVAPAPALLVPVELLHELGDGAEVGVTHLLHQHHVVAAQDLQGQERWQWLGALGW